MKSKPILRPEALRHVPRQFSWIDQRLVRDRHISRCGSDALALYLLLCTVADAQGISYYSDISAARLLSLSEGKLRAARLQLIAAGLIAFEPPFYQVLSLDPGQHQRAAASIPVPAQTPPPVRAAEPLSFNEILRKITQQP